MAHSWHFESHGVLIFVAFYVRGKIRSVKTQKLGMTDILRKNNTGQKN